MQEGLPWAWSRITDFTMSEPTRILILEDDHSMCEILSSVLEDEGFLIESAYQAADAIDIAAVLPIDLVILDVRMPGLDGLEALALMRPNLNSAAVLVVTGYASEADSVRALRLGVADYLHKPFELPIFLNKVHSLVRKTRLERLRAQSQQRLSQLASWSLAQLLRGVDGQLVPSGLNTTATKAAQLARQTASKIGLQSPDLEELEAAVILLSTGKLIPDMAVTANPQIPVANAITQRAKHLPSANAAQPLQTASISDLPGQIADLAIEAATTGCIPEQGFESLLIEAAQDCLVETCTTELAPTSLVELGSFLLHTGNLEGASQAFTQATLDGNLLSSIKAWLGLAEVQRLSGQYSAIIEPLQHAIDHAKLIGPAQTGKTLLSAGLTLLMCLHPKTFSFLKNAQLTLSRLELQPYLSRANISLSRFEPLTPQLFMQNLEILLQLPHREDTASDLPWLVSTLVLHAQNGSGFRDLADLSVKYLGIFIKHWPNLIAKLVIDCQPSADLLGKLALSVGGGYLPPQWRQQLASCRDAQVQDYLQSNLGSVGSPPLPTLWITALGAYQLKIGDNILDSEERLTTKSRLLLAFLVCNENGIGEEELIEEFWPAPLQGRKCLANACSRIRYTLKPYYQDRELIQRQHNVVRFNRDIPVYCDVIEVKKAWKHPNTAMRISSLRRIVDLCNGPFLEAYYADWIAALRQQIDTILQSALHELSVHYYTQEMIAECLEYSQRLVREDPLSAAACELVMACLNKLGRYEQAIRQYNSYSKFLENELSLKPNVKITELWQKARLGIS